jgi:hypothetical protein
MSVYPHSPHEQPGLQPQLPYFPEHGAAELRPIQGQAVYPGDESSPNTSLPPPASSGQEQDMQPTYEGPSQLPEKVGPLAVAAEVEAPVPRLTITDRPQDPVTEATRAALQRLETAMSQETEPSDFRAAKWWHKARDADSLALDERSQVQGGHKPWDITDSGLTGERSYSETFDRLVPGDMTLKDDIEAFAAAVKQPKTIGIELGGTGSRLSEDLHGILDASISVSLTDYRRSLPNGEAIIAADEARGHHVIEGNILRQATREAVEELLGGVRPTFIIQRMVGGHASMPYDAPGLGRQARYWYELLATEGGMYNEGPPALALLLPSWVKAARQAGLHVNYDAIPSFNPQTDEKMHIVRIHKQPGSPRRLPFITSPSYRR